MNANVRFGFVLLVAAQACHSVEEYLHRLYDVLAPARFVSDLVAADRAGGFAAVNAALVLFGLWSWLWPVRRDWPSARTFAIGWALFELANGCGHLLFTAGAGGYFPGLYTAPLLIAVSLWLLFGLVSRGWGEARRP